MTRRTLNTPDGGRGLALGDLKRHFPDADRRIGSKQSIKNKGVFLNVPYDEEHAPIVEAVIFAVFDCGYIPRLAIQDMDSSKTRLEKIVSGILVCPYSIHDVSLRSTDHSEPRLNMAFELGLALGASRAGQGKKPTFILSHSRFGHQRYVSDLSGLDIVSHDLDPAKAIAATRSFLFSLTPNTWMPSAKSILVKLRDYQELEQRVADASSDELAHQDRLLLMAAFLIDHEERSK